MNTITNIAIMWFVLIILWAWWAPKEVGQWYADVFDGFQRRRDELRRKREAQP